MGVGAVVIAKVNEAWRFPHFGVKKRLPKRMPHCVFFEGIAWHSKAEFDNLQTQVFEFWVEPSVGKSDRQTVTTSVLGRPQLVGLVLAACPTAKNGVAVTRDYQASAS